MNTCKDCNKRTVGCHSQCSDYLQWKEKHEEDRQKVIKHFQKKRDAYYHK